MERIIEIDESLYNRVKGKIVTLSDIPVLCKAVDDSTPYNQEGVLTEAEKKICKIYLEDLDKTHTCNEYMLIMSLIDNAPAVSIDWGIDGGDRTIYARPQGEWICPNCDLYEQAEDDYCQYAGECTIGCRECRYFKQKGGAK